MSKLTLAELRDRVKVSRSGYGRYDVTITFRGRRYRCTSNNSLAYDMLDWVPGESRHWYRTARQAWLAFYDEVKNENQL